MEGDDDRTRRAGQIHVAFVDAAHERVQQVDLYFRVIELSKLVLQRLDRARRIGLDDDRQLFHRSTLNGYEDVFHRAFAAARREGQRAAALAADFGDLACGVEVVHHKELIARIRHLIESGDTDWRGRQSFRDFLVPFVVHRADVAVRTATEQDVTNSQRAVLNHRQRDHAATFVAKRFDADADGRTFRIRLELVDFGGQQQQFEQVINAFSRQSRRANHFDFAAPFLHEHALGREIAEHALLVAVGKVNLVEGDDNRRVGRFRVSDALDGLRHDTIIGRDDQHDDVGAVGSTSAHLTEGRVAGRVHERDFVPVVIDLIGAHMLSDSARLARCNIG